MLNDSPQWGFFHLKVGGDVVEICQLKIEPTLPETNSSHLKMDGWNTWNTIVSFWDGLFSGAMLQF